MCLFFLGLAMATGCSCKKCKPARCTCNRDKRNCGEQCGCFPPKGIQAFFISFDIWTFLLLDQGWTFVVLQNIAGEIAKKEGLQSIEWYLYVLQYLPVYTPCHCRRLIGLALVVATFLSFVKGYNKKKNRPCRWPSPLLSPQFGLIWQSHIHCRCYISHINDKRER